MFLHLTLKVLGLNVMVTQSTSATAEQNTQESNAAAAADEARAAASDLKCESERDTDEDLQESI